MSALELHHRVNGSGPPLLMLHGLFGSQENLGGIGRLLATDYRVHGVDLRNHGRSPHSDHFSYEWMAQDVLKTLDSQGLAQVDLVGHSMGGKTAMTLALKYPERVRRLVVIDIAPVHYPPHHDDILKGLSSLDLSQLESREQADRELAAHVPELPVRQFLLKNLVKGGPDCFLWRLNLSAIQRHYAEILVGQEAGRFEGPVLFIKGGDSQYIQSKHWPQIETLFPAAQLRIIPHTGHWLHAEKPEVVAATIRRFLQQNPAP